MARARVKSCCAAACVIGLLLASVPSAAAPKNARGEANVLTPLRQRQSDQAVDRALAWLASQQRPDGSFPTVRPAQPGITGLCLLAFLSRGHLPDQGPYGATITRAVHFILSCQAENGMLSLGPVERTFVHDSYSHCAAYNHGIAGLALCEAYG